MNTGNCRVRFAPAPTGMMHLGNVRTALMNYLFAQQKDGCFILRIEDTDASRNFDPEAREIIADLTWLGLLYNEGPIIGGPYAPYFQSQRNAIYQENLEILKRTGAIYPCFCTTEELEKKRVRQQALKQPPRYDRTCLYISADERAEKLKTLPHLWRIELNHESSVTINDLSHGSITFDLKNFSDFPLTRMDGTFTFMFANFVDDMTMHMTHVFRGDDHLTNTAGQAELYRVFGKTLPTFWHMPILCNIEGKKLSKRDFGFSLRDLQKSGYLPEAICNYLAILGGSYEKEILSLEELVTTIQFDHLHSASHIKYDVEKLNWVNRQWIARLDAVTLVHRIKPRLEEAFGSSVQSLNDVTLHTLLEAVKSELTTLHDAVEQLRFVFEKPQLTKESFESCGTPEVLATVSDIVTSHLSLASDHDQFMNVLKKEFKDRGLSMKALFHYIRICLTGSPEGQSIKTIMEMLGTEETIERLKAGCALFN
jgi:glutamyl-tRNA synthetase